ncbi:Hypothetical protein GSB_155099, partial [Giardia duodenalis]
VEQVCEHLPTEEELCSLGEREDVAKTSLKNTAYFEQA